MPVLSGYIFRLHQGGIEVAKATCQSRREAWEMILHYAMVYSQDGEPVSITPAPPSEWIEELRGKG